MRISRVSIENLFGIFDHVIPFNLEDHMTIIHGPNGFGKTILLRMIDDLFRSNYEIFFEIPFKTFEITFGDESYIKVNKAIEYDIFVQKRLFELETEKDTLAPGRTKLNIDIYKPGHEEQTFRPPKPKDKRTLMSLVRLRAEAVGFERVGNFWRNYNTGETYTTDALYRRFGPLISEAELEGEEPDLFREIKRSVNIQFIETQRLLNTSDKRASREASVAELAVEKYAQELSGTIRQKLAESVALSQSLDRTFPGRLVDWVAQNEQQEISSENLREQLNALEAKRSHLIEAGLLDREDDSMSFQIYKQTDERTRNVLSIYIRDVKQKLSIFDDLADRIDLFKEIINSRFSETYKKMIISKNSGFMFLTFEGKLLSIKRLSSGEQHELVLLYELLFKVKPNSLILIDEPEISLHIGWQEKFLKDLGKITALSSFDVVIATHSPQLIDDRWDLTVELKGRQ